MLKFSKSPLLAWVGLGAVAIGLSVSPLAYQNVAWANHDDEEELAVEANPDFSAPYVAGTVHRIGTSGSAPAAVIIDNNTGLEIVVVAKNPEVVRQFTNRTVCAGRYIEAAGVRLSPEVLDAHGLKVQGTGNC